MGGIAAAAGAAPVNPFRIHGVVSEAFFTDRTAELRRLHATLTEPGAKLVVYGPRRMGKTSLVTEAIRRAERRGGAAFLADLSTVSTVADIANRILEAAARTLGRKWKDSITDLVARLGLSVSLSPDPATGLVLPSLDVALRSAPIDLQRASLAATLDTVDALAKSRKTTIGVVLDEFQEIHRFGGEDAEWHLRGAIQHHAHVSYVLAGSEALLIERMLGKGRAFYGLLDQLALGPIEPSHLSAWIDERMVRNGVKTRTVGARATALAGPRTRDIIQVARRCFDRTRPARVGTAADVDLAFDDIVAEQDAALRSTWESLTAAQQNVLRAVSANLGGLTTHQTVARFGLRSSGTATNSAAALVDAGILIKIPGATGYTFDNPFFTRWVAVNTLGDLGLPVPPLAESRQT